MKPKQENTIKTEIEKFKIDHGGDYSNYYIGITRSLDRRIIEASLTEHIRVGIYDPETPRYEAKAESRDIAFKIETEFQKKGMKQYNAAGKGKEDSFYIYCFKIKSEILNERALPTTSDIIKASVEHGRKKERMRWFVSFKRFFGI